MDEEKTQDLEEKGQEVDEQEEEDNLFTDTFKEAGAKNQADAKEAEAKAGDKESKESDKDPSGKKESYEGSEKEEKEEPGPAKKIIDNRAKRLQEIMTKAKEKSDEKQVQKGEKRKIAAAEEEEPEPGEEEPEPEGDEDDDDDDKPARGRKDSAPPILKGLKLSKAEQGLIDDMPESVSIMEKIAKKALKDGDKDSSLKDMKAIVDAQGEEIAVLRTEIVISKLVPDYEEIIFVEGQLDENGEKVPNPEFWGWLDKQPDLVKALSRSYNPKDNAAVLNYYKEDLAKKKVSGKDQKDRESLKKIQDIHGYSPTGKKAVKKSGGEPGEDDFGAHFKIASTKGKK